jgi:hypothetical protein
MMANEAGPVAAPSMAPSVRKAMSEPALQATADAAAVIRHAHHAPQEQATVAEAVAELAHQRARPRRRRAWAR